MSTVIPGMRERRVSRGWTVRHLCMRAHVNYDVACRADRGESIREDSALRLARALDYEHALTPYIKAPRSAANGARGATHNGSEVRSEHTESN